MSSWQDQPEQNKHDLPTFLLELPISSILEELKRLCEQHLLKMSNMSEEEKYLQQVRTLTQESCQSDSMGQMMDRSS